MKPNVQLDSMAPIVHKNAVAITIHRAMHKRVNALAAKVGLENSVQIHVRMAPTVSIAKKFVQTLNKVTKLVITLPVNTFVVLVISVRRASIHVQKALLVKTASSSVRVKMVPNAIT